MKNHFKTSEFLIQENTLSATIADKIWLYHIMPMNPVREKLDRAMWPSEKSSYRPYKYELSKGRSGNSQHTFGETENGTFDDDHKGATDWTCSGFAVNDLSEDETNGEILLDLIIEMTDYTRICVYKGFIHTDYKHKGEGKQLFDYNEETGKWDFVKLV